MLDLLKLTEELVEHEGLRLKVYRCPAGKLTIGVGRNLEDRGITESEASMLLENDIEYYQENMPHKDIYDKLDPVRQRVLLNMCFNLGPKGLKGFKKMWVALSQGMYDLAADEMKDSKWYHDVGNRAEYLINLMRNG